MNEDRPLPDVRGADRLLAEQSAVDLAGHLRSTPLAGVRFRPTRPVPHEDGLVTKVARASWDALDKPIVQVHITTTFAGRVRASGLHPLSPDRLFVVAGLMKLVVYHGRHDSPTVGRWNEFVVKAPLVYVKVAVRNWRPWVARRVHEIANPMGFYSRVKLDYPVSLGDYRFARTPDEPMVLHLVHVPTLRGPGIDLRTRLRAGRAQLFATPFDTFERNARDELTRMLGAGGFDAERDIAAITVSRWGHGYSYSGSSLFDNEGDDERIPALARRRAGRVAFANSDANWEPYAHGAFDQAHRAVNDLLGTATPKRE